MTKLLQGESDESEESCIGLRCCWDSGTRSQRLTDVDGHRQHQ